MYNLDIIRRRGFLQTVTVTENKNIFKLNGKLCEFRETICIYTHKYIIYLYMFHIVTTNLFHDYGDDDVEMMTCSDRRI